MLFFFAEDRFEAFIPGLLVEPKKDEDIYSQLGRTMPHPLLPREVVLTDENFDERIKESEKTVVLFYISCKKLADKKKLNIVPSLSLRVGGKQSAATSFDGCLGAAGLQ